MLSRILELSLALIDQVNNAVNDTLKDYPPITLIAGTVAAVFFSASAIPFASLGPFLFDITYGYKLW